MIVNQLIRQTTLCQRFYLMIYLILIIALAGIVFGADWLVSGSVSIAKRFKVSEFVIGAAIVGVGTSMPELTVSFIGALQGNSDVAIGNVVGSNIFNVLGILGLTAAFFPIKVDRSNLRFEIPFCIFLSVLLTLQAFNFFTGGTPVIGRVDGIILLLLFAIFMWYSFYRDRKSAEELGVQAEKQDCSEPVAPLWKAILTVILGLGVLIVSCDVFVDKAVHVAKMLGMSEAVISLTLIACGTSLPELAASVAAAIKKNTQLALGNIIGSNIFNISLILGLSSQVTPLTSTGITFVDYLVMIGAAVITMIFGFTGKIGRAAGILLFSMFATYTIYLLN